MPVGLVSGATRGVGRGIAVSLGAAGWTVWVTGRSTRATGSTSHLPGTVEDTAEAVSSAGGTDIPWRCDHTDDDSVKSLARAIDEPRRTRGGGAGRRPGAWPVQRPGCSGCRAG